MGILDSGGNLIIIWVHGDAEKTAPYMQTLHFGFGNTTPNIFKSQIKRF